MSFPNSLQGEQMSCIQASTSHVQSNAVHMHDHVHSHITLFPTNMSKRYKFALLCWQDREQDSQSPYLKEYNTSDDLFTMTVPKILWVVLHSYGMWQGQDDHCTMWESLHWEKVNVNFSLDWERDWIDCM